MTGSSPFIPGLISEDQIPLSRYLPQVPQGVVSELLKDKVVKGDWILDPFGTTPWIPIDIARAGYKVLVAAHNPVIRFLIEFLADPPTELQLQSALAYLAAETKGDTRIEGFINSLYKTNCLHCGISVPTQAYIWERGGRFPTRREYSCPNCYEEGIFPTTEADANLASRFQDSGLHQARAQERIAALDDPDRIHVNKALSVYSPRAVYALFTILNKYDNFPEKHRKSMTALLLAVLDQGTNLWPYPPENIRPKILTTYSQYKEKNIWRELEMAVSQWERSLSNLYKESSKITVSYWPDLPTGFSGICIYDGRFRGLSKQLTNNFGTDGIKVSLSAIPRLNQAFWSLSVIWSGWLWGHESASKIKGILRRKRYDWYWHSNTLYKSYIDLAQAFSNGISFYGLISEAESAYLGSTLTAAWLANFRLINIAQRIDSGEIQLALKSRNGNCNVNNTISQFSTENSQSRFFEPVAEYLLSILEPAKYLSVYTAGYSKMVQQNSPGSSLEELNSGEVYNKLNNILIESLSNEERLNRIGKSEHSLDNASFWLHEEYYISEFQRGNFFTLGDSVELEIVSFLRKFKQIRSHEMDKAVCNIFPGFKTPEIKLIRKCLDSYAEESSKEPGLWTIRDQEMIEMRKNDLLQVGALIREVGRLLNYKIRKFEKYPYNLIIENQIIEPEIIIWEDDNRKSSYIFFIVTTAVLGNIILPSFLGLHSTIAAINHIQNKVILLPGGRAGLIGFKTERDVRFGDIQNLGWTFLKYRHLRRLADNQLLTRSKFVENLNLDPLANTDPQMKFL